MGTDVPICIGRSLDSLLAAFSTTAPGLSRCLAKPGAESIFTPQVCLVSSRPLNYSQLKIKRGDSSEQWVSVVNNQM